MSDTQQKETGMWQIIEYGEKHCTEDQRQNICHTLADALDLDYDNIINSRALSLLTDVELRALESFGIDVQLHTHRHRFPPTDLEFCRREILENRDYLSGVLGKQLTHFCYPSGVWNKNQWDLLDELNIESATTCEPGKNTKNTPMLGLNRFLDEDDLPQIEFEAEIVGFKDLLRGVKTHFPTGK